MTDIELVSGRRLRGRVRVPGDKSISHRALILGALAEGTTRIRGLSQGEDVQRMAEAVAALGAVIVPGDSGEVAVTGGDLHEASSPVDLGNSGTAIRLLAGVVAGFDWLTVLYGDRWLAERPMDRVAVPLRAMGATVDGRDGGRLPPLAVRGGSLRGIDYTLPIASAQVKSAVLLAGLRASGPSTVREPAPARAHTEEMLAAFGASVTVDGLDVTVMPSTLKAIAVDVPGDPSQAAFWIVAACVVPDSDVTVEGVYVGRARAAFLDVLARMGADIEVTHLDATTADIRARSSVLRATAVGGEEVPALIDEIPILAVAAACADGVTEFRDAAELRVKETDRVAAMVDALASLGAGAEPLPDGVIVKGGGRMHGGLIDGGGDHRIAMAGAIAALAAEGPTTVRGWEAVATSYPGFVDDLRRLQA